MGASEAAWSSSIPTRESADTADSTRPLLSKYPENEDEPDAPAKSDIPVAVAVGPRVEYVYKPIYPRTGDRQDAVGIIGKTRRDTVAFVQRGFSDLAGLDPGRIRLQIVVGKGVERRWGTVLDEAWDEVMKDPPKNINIVIDDSPEDKIARSHRERRIWFWVTLVVVALAAGISWIIWFVVTAEEARRQGIRADSRRRL